MICQNFAPNPFKKDMCMTCQKNKALHPDKALPTDMLSTPYTGPPCSHFAPNPFKKDICSTCQQPQALHVISSKDCRESNVPISTQSRQSTRCCGEYKKHAFKDNICAHCGCSFDSHYTALATKTQHYDCNDNIVFKQTHSSMDEKNHFSSYDVVTEGCKDFREHAFKRNICVNCGKTKDDHNRVTGPQFGSRSSAVDKVKAEGKEIKPILQVSGSIAACSQNERDANRTHPNKAEQGETNQYQESEKKCDDRDVNTNDCSDFREHAFKRNICVNCGKAKEDHTTKNNISECFHSNCHTLNNPLVRVPVKAPESKRTLENESSDSEEDAPSTKPLDRVPVKAPSFKRTLENESSDSEEDTPSTKPLDRVPVKAPSSKRTLENESSESEDAAPSTKPLVRVPVKVPESKRTLENESSESEDAVPSTKPLVRVPVKVPSSKRTLENESSDSEDDAPSTKPLVRVPVKAPSSKRTLENESSDSEEDAPSTKPLVRVPVKAPSSKHTLENESSDSEEDTPSTKPLVRVPVKAPESKRTFENESSESGDGAPSTKPLVRVPVKAPESKRTLENESSDSEEDAPSTKPLVRVPVKAPSSKRTFENESSESGDGA